MGSLGSFFLGFCYGFVSDMVIGIGFLEARSEMVEVTGIEGFIFGGIKFGKEVVGEVRWFRRRGGRLK